MNNTRKTISIALAAALVLSIASTLALSLTPAQANKNISQGNDSVLKYRTSGKIASGQWFAEDEADNTFTEVYLFMIDSATNVNGGYPESFMDMVIYQYQLTETCEDYYGEEYCYYDYVPLLEFYGFAELNKSDFAISNNLRSASITGLEVTGYDYISGEEKTINVDAEWTSSGGMLKEKSSYSQTNEFFKISLKGMGAGRDADASVDISGDIDVNLDQNSNYGALLAKFRQAVLYKIIEQP
ncbi:MAG: hypothetical protein MN733_34210 [Nitrososphaera sp.]|nr:hypothetical protein [Nitrososphaera sp.]